MDESVFINTATKIFSDIQAHYKFTEKADTNVLRYSNDGISFSIYFERNFEIYIIFCFQNTDMRMLDIAKWLNFEESDILLVSRNQVAKTDHINTVLKNLCSVAEKMLCILYNNPDLLEYCLVKQKETYTNRSLEAPLLLALRQSWHMKKFKDYLILYEANEEQILKTPSSKLFSKQASYARNHLTQAKKTD